MNSAEKRAKTNMERRGVENPFQDEKVKEKIRQTNLKRYGVDHPMKCSAIRAKQALSAGTGMTAVEKRFNELSGPNVVFTGYGARVIHSKRVVHKLGRKMRDLCPDFMVFSDSSSYEAQAASDVSGEMRKMSSGFIIEVFGDYYHSEAVIGVPREVHEMEVRDAYASVGIDCLILWESDILHNWIEISGGVLAWIEKAKGEMGKKHSRLPVTIDSDALRSLASPEYWRGLSPKRRKNVVSELIQSYQDSGFPYPDEFQAEEDFLKFCKWAKDTKPKGRPTRFGLDCCRGFIPSMSAAQVKGMRSLRDLWNDRELMETAIEWQLLNENGRHGARRFLNAMCFKTGFRTISNLHPSKVFQWVKEYSKPEKGEIFFDPCSGWGGRMLASHALGMKYIGIDANKVLVEELKKMSKKLGIDAEVYHGDSSDRKFVKKIMGGRKACVSFTSPPYFDKEWYGDDKEQSVLRYPDRDSWEKGFIGGMVESTLSILSPSSSVILNVDMDLNLCCLYAQGWSVSSKDVLMENSRKKHLERIVKISQSKGKGDVLESTSNYIVCRVCGGKFEKISEHIRKNHGLSNVEYNELYPSALTISDDASARISSILKGKVRGRYKRRTVYCCPNGRVVKKRDAWVRAWAPGVPPEDSILDADSVKLDGGEDKKEGIDYVVCKICGHKGKNITRHVRREHDIDSYTGPLKSKKYIEKSHLAANKTWDTRGRKPERDKSKNKTHKVNALDEAKLRELYIDEKLSDAKIGVLFEMTGEGVAYRRKKWGIPTRKRKLSLSGS